MSFLNRRGAGENTLVVDIGSGSVAAALAHTHDHDLPEILASIRTPFSSSSEKAEMDIDSSMLSALKSTLSSISSRLGALREKGYDTTISKALISFSSPWATSHLKTVIVTKEKGFRLDDQVIKAIMDEEKELLTTRLNEGQQEASEMFESVITNLYVNGYEAKYPPRDKVKKAEVSFILSGAKKDLILKVESELIRSFGIKRGVAYHSFMYCFFKVLSHSFQSLHSALLINMTSEMTDVLFLRHGSSALSASIPFGPALITSSVAKRLKIPDEIAESYLCAFAAGAFDEASTSAVDSVLTEVEAEWTKLWESMGESIPEGSSVPYSIFLVVPSGYERLMKTFLEGVLPDKHIIVLGETNTFTKELVKTTAESAQDEGLLVLSSFSNLLK